MRTLIPSITVISFTSEDLIGFSSTGAKLQDDPEDEDEDVALRVLFLEEGATGGGDRLLGGGSRGKITCYCVLISSVLETLEGREQRFLFRVG